MDIDDIQENLRTFARERNWERYHNPKNLAMALSVEASELLEIFQWLSPAESDSVVQSERGRIEVEDELADIGIYLLRLADVLGVELETAIENKIEKNATKYPPGDATPRSVRGK
jgi:NTP pyrophosphatase (non-canonical NTP hydrolase)